MSYKCHACSICKSAAKNCQFIRNSAHINCLRPIKIYWIRNFGFCELTKIFVIRISFTEIRSIGCTQCDMEIVVVTLPLPNGNPSVCVHTVIHTFSSWMRSRRLKSIKFQWNENETNQRSADGVVRTHQ